MTGSSALASVPKLDARSLLAAVNAQQDLVDDGGTITGIVDWDGIGRGDRRFSLVTMRFAAMTQHADAETSALLDTVLDASFPGEDGRRLLRAYWASMSLREIDWAIRNYPQERVDAVLTLAESRMD